MKLQFRRADIDDIKIVEENGMFNPLIIDSGFGEPSDIA